MENAEQEQFEKLQKSLKLLENKAKLAQQAGDDPTKFEVGFGFADAPENSNLERE